MLKRIVVATLCVAIGSSLAFAAPSAKSETHDLLAAASNNAVSQNSVGVQKLSKAEMEQVEGGMRIKVRVTCKAGCRIRFH